MCLAQDNVRGHVVALKTLRHVDGADANARLRREFRTLKDFDHPGIVELFELHIDDDECLFTMEFVRGEPITRAVESGPLELRTQRIRHYLRLLVDAVATLHGGGFVHRDLKPSNILVTPEGRLVVLDAGLARSIDGSSRQSFAGTVLYMSPEQARGAASTPASDWYAVGVIAYELFAGAPPFVDEPFVVIHQKTTGPAPAVASRAASIDAHDAAMIDALLAERQEDRPGSSDLVRWLAQSVKASDDEDLRRGAETTFVGRTREMTELDELYDARASSCAYVTVSGPSGIGKTALLGEWLVRLGPRSDTAVYTGRCYQREAVPFNGFDEMFEALESALGADLAAGLVLPSDVVAAASRIPGWRVMPAAATTADGASLPPDPIEQRRATARAVVRILRHVVADRRLVLWLDDVQWGPIETSFVLAELSRIAWSQGAFVVLSHRLPSAGDGPCLAVLGDVVPISGRVVLSPLEDHEARALVDANAAKTLDDGAVRRLVSDGAGHPLLLTQAARLLASLDRDVTMSLDDLLRARVAALHESPRRVLVALCVARTPISERSAVLAADAATSDGAARRLLAAGLIRRAGATGHMLVPFHDKLRVAVLDKLEREELATWNLRLARALEGEAEPEFLIDYLVAAGERQRAYALVSEAAARMDRRFAFARSAELCRLALELAPEFASDHVQAARLALGEALVNCGRCHDAALVFIEAARHASAEDADALNGRAALELLRGGYIVDGLELAHRSFRRLGIKLSSTSLRAIPSILWGRLRLWRRGHRYELKPEQALSAEVLTRIDWCLEVGTVLPLVDFLRGFQVHNQGLLWALDAGEPKRLARVLAMEVGYRNALGTDRKGKAAWFQRSADTLADGTGDPLARAVVQIMRASACWSVGDWVGCVDSASEGARMLRERCRGVSWEVNFAMTHQLDAMVWLADFDAHERAFRAELEDAIARGDRYAQLMYVVRDLMMNATVRDTLEAAEARADGAMDAFGDRGFQVEHLAELFERNHFALYRMQGEVAYGLYASSWKRIKQSQLLRNKPFGIETRSGRGRAALLLASSLPRGRRRDKLVDEGARLGRRIEAEPPGTRSLVLGCPVVAGAAYLAGDRARALARLERGIEDASRTRMLAHELAFRHVAAKLRGGAEADRDATDALDKLGARGVKRPERYVQVLVTGFGEML